MFNKIIIISSLGIHIIVFFIYFDRVNFFNFIIYCRNLKTQQNNGYYTSFNKYRIAWALLLNYLKINRTFLWLMNSFWYLIDGVRCEDKFIAYFMRTAASAAKRGTNVKNEKNRALNSHELPLNQVKFNEWNGKME